MNHKSELGVIEDTLYVPMLGRIYASEHCRDILYDKKALELKEKIPSDILAHDTQTQYTLLASASRSANVDRYIADFLKRKPDGIIVQLGCGLETAFYRNGNGKTQWYAVDLPHVIDYRKTLLPEPSREKYISGDAFQEDWLKEIRSEYPHSPLLVTASGLFYYFEEEKILSLLRMLHRYGNIELLFDTDNKSGMTMMKKKHMKTVGHEDAQMFFYVDAAKELAGKIDSNARILAEEKYYSHIKKKGLKLSCKASMVISDWLGMVKMIHLSL